MTRKQRHSLLRVHTRIGRPRGRDEGWMGPGRKSSLYHEACVE